MNFTIISRINPVTRIPGAARSIGHRANYHDAVILAQEKSDWGQWWIECGAYVPTREEQLLLPNLSHRTNKTTTTKIKRLLNSI